MREVSSGSDLDLHTFSKALVGIPIDDRGKAAVGHLESLGISKSELTYHADTFQLSLDGSFTSADDLDSIYRPLRDESLILEATTLGVAELLLMCRAARTAGTSKLGFLYVEPLRYASQRRTDLLHRRDFELTQEFLGFKSIPEFVINLADHRPSRGVFFLGYEERRLDRAFEDHQMINGDNCAVVFGVPAFAPGWEMNAFSRNLRVIRDKGIRPEVSFCGAENPQAAYGLLERVLSSLKPGERMFVAPLGTKPNGIGVALFCADNEKVGILYDHPQRKPGRTESATRWHLYEAIF